MDLFGTTFKTGPYAHKTPAEKFCLFVAPNLGTDCWDWSGKLYRNGYGSFSIGTRGYLAHRVAWILAGNELNEGVEICHTCDNRRCVRPSHLFQDTHSVNMRDMVNKGRNNPPRGEKSGKAKLTSDQVSKIRALRTSGAYQRDIALIFGVSAKQISVICSGKQWSVNRE